MMIVGITGAVVVVMALMAWLFVVLARSTRLSGVRQSLDMKLLLIRLPQPQSKDQPSGFKDEINKSEQLWAILASLPELSSLEVAVSHVGEEILFYLAVPVSSVESVSRQIEGLFKDAQVTHAHEYNIFQPNGAHVGFCITQDKHYSLPFRTYLESELDTFSPIVSGLSKINEIGEGAVLQILIKKAPDFYKKNIFSLINELRKGASFKKLTDQKLISAEDVALFFKPAESQTSDTQKEEKVSIVDQESIKMLEKKVSKPLLCANYRILVSTTNPVQTESIAQGIVNGFSQFDAPLRNKVSVVKVKNFQKFSYQYTFREFDTARALVLNTEELASMFHLPTSTTLSPRIKWLKSKEAPPPADLPIQGTKIGSSFYKGISKPIYITDEDKRRHVYVIGQTGTGKTSLVVNMALDDIRRGNGVAIMDPHGELAEKLLGLVPKERLDDVIYFDPGFMQRPIGLNMLEYDFDKPEQKTFIVNELLSIFDKLYDLKTTGGPMFEMYMRNALLLLMEDARNEPATLMEVPRIFTDAEFRNRKLERVSNPVVVDFWTKEAVKVGGEASLSNMAPYITSKFNNFIANDYMRPIVGQIHSTLNFRRIMDEKKILLINLAKGRVGEINSNLLGMIIIGKILMAAFSRIDVPDAQRNDFNLYIDEFQNFSTDSIASILSEARKFHLNLIVVHQYIKQLTEKIRDAVFGNVGSIISLRVGPEDADFLVKQFEPVFSQNDLISLDNFNACAKVLINGQTSRPFNIVTPTYPAFDTTAIDKMKELSFLKYGTDRAVVERDILTRLRD